MNLHTISAAALAASTALLVGGCSDDSAGAAATDRPDTSATSPGDTSSVSARPGEQSGDYQVLGRATRENLDPGRWAIAATGARDVPRAVLDLPAGLNGGDGYIWSTGGAPENDGWVLGYWTVGEVHLDPCTRAGGTFDTQQHQFPDIWVEALAAQRRTTTTQPEPVALDGYDGAYVELISPTGLDYSRCRENGLAIFDTSTKGDHHLIDTPGVVERYWALDLDGERVVLSGAVLPETTDRQADQLTDIVESVRFERP